MILDSGKTVSYDIIGDSLFESVVILDSGKTNYDETELETVFESVVILDRFSKGGQNLWRLLPPFFCIPRPHCLLTKGAL